MTNTTPQGLNLCAGDVVQVRTKEEILRTLDKNGRLDQMPFMPEMLKHCGRTFTVSKRAHKTCDPVNGLESRGMPNTVHLEDLRCGGEHHAGCQAGCLFFFKDAWLKRVDGNQAAGGSVTAAGCSEDDLYTGTLAEGESLNGENPTFVCQATQVAAATVPIKWWDIKQYVEDYKSGNAGIAQMISAFLFWSFQSASGLGLGLGAGMRWSYDTFQRLIGGSPYPWRVGRVPKGVRTPTAKLDIQEGELVKIKKYSDILETLDDEWKNRGLYFDGEMVPYTNGTFKVLKRVKRIIDEKTGKMLNFKNEALILDKVTCQARYAKCRKLCPRAYYLYWREIWVERAPAECSEASEPACQVASEAVR